MIDGVVPKRFRLALAGVAEVSKRLKQSQT